MLRELRIRGFAVIDELHLELGPGLNVLTGETGAGKSIIVGALSLLLGERASSDVVRSGEARTVVEGRFDLDGDGRAAERCRDAGVDVEDGWLLLRREIQREGRNRVWINGSPATAALLRSVSDALVDLHGQHEVQTLLHRNGQQAILDAFAGADGLAREVAGAHAALTAARAAVDEIRRRVAEARERADYLRFKADEIERAALRPGEDEEGASEARRLEHSEELLGLSGSLHEAVYAGEASLTETLGGLHRGLTDLARIDPDTEPLSELYESALHALEELGRRLGDYSRSVEHDPARLAGLRARLDEIYRLKRKYGASIQEVLAAGAAARTELDELEGSDLRIRELEREEEEAGQRLSELAGRLTEARTEAARRLEAEVGRILPELGMEAGRLAVSMDPLAEPSATGAERIEFRVALNPGFEPGPLARVASGGELSRVMLALKTVLADVDRVPCLVFDEIDSGVGGRVAHRVAERLVRVAARHQVFVVTHLPQIASRADAHWRVDKTESDGRAVATVARLDAAARVEEVARMLGGDPGSEVSRRHAQEMLAGGGAATG
ncbi:MAG: DNA repair protein RecN [Gemmatimonadota bacterium]